jgi:hypothetical protein
MFHKRKGHDIKDCVSYKWAQNFFESKWKDSNSTNKSILVQYDVERVSLAVLEKHLN